MIAKSEQALVPWSVPARGAPSLAGYTF